MSPAPIPENAAVKLLTQHKERYAMELKRLEAQLKGVEAKIASTQGKLDATTEALKALSGPPDPDDVSDL